MASSCQPNCEVLQGTRFHSDLALMEELNLLSDRAVILADNVLKPGAPLYIWHLAKGSCLDIFRGARVAGPP